MGALHLITAGAGGNDARLPARPHVASVDASTGLCRRMHVEGIDTPRYRTNSRATRKSTYDRGGPTGEQQTPASKQSGRRSVFAYRSSG